jgi:two-component system sensor histidine kinase YesM
VKLSLDDDIVDFLLADMEDTSENYPETFRAKKKLEDYASIFSYIDSIYVYSRKNDYVVTDTEGRTVQLFQDRNWYDNITERIYEPARMMSRMKYGYYPYLISYIQPVRLTQMQYLGGIIVNIDVDQISEYTSATGDEIFLTVDDRDNVIFSSAEPYRMKKRTELSVLDEYDSDGASSQMIEGDGKKLIVSTVDSDVFNWKYIAIVSNSKIPDISKRAGNLCCETVGSYRDCIGGLCNSYRPVQLQPDSSYLESCERS